MREILNSGKNGIFRIAHIIRVYWNPERERFMVQIGDMGWEIDQDKELLIPRDLRPDQWALRHREIVPVAAAELSCRVPDGRHRYVDGVCIWCDADQGAAL